MAGKAVVCSNREAWEACDAMGALVTHGWRDHKVALALGRTFRALRSVRDEIEEGRSSLLAGHAVVAEDGGYAKNEDGTIRVKDDQGFNVEWRKLLAEPVELTLYPLTVKQLTDAGLKKSDKPCQTCKHVPPTLTAMQLEALVHVGAIELGEEEEDGD